MSELTKTFLIANALRFVLFLIYIVAVALSVKRRKELGDAALFSGLGFASFAVAAAVSLGALYWQMMAMSREAPALEIAKIASGAYFVAQLLAIGGTVLVLIAVLSPRPARNAT
ncbi:MAG TPA: hypothetical protein VKB41_12930 [Steroidobacteraceae bacterium]|nr:hypothetical protein [Steroidobacteraceae bacterium]